ncbi:TonB-dependent siderophore receptor [Catenovulum sp. 2E275]|uniref:TonB-dependent siderophore receptor n=1 Tax=Catenovulum sp. 2E275 TaxID=2980497 RepID=UPI0021D09234|nr:TonB-dependent siderophore receptor [Catenovulum sp. 2E275]MCU4675389.1 TonB-dependent siderophore receptor [Catenovulum sp. 2E275]
MKLKHLPLSAAILFALNPLNAMAAEQTTQGNEQTSKDDIEVITVSGKYSVSQTLDTATGLGLTLRETPQSVTILTSDRMFDQNINTVTDAVNNAVGVVTEETDNVRNSFFSRGFSVDSYQLDGVPTSWSLGGDSGETVADVALYDRIEFVRGATGLLTSVGNPSVSINLVRKHAGSKKLKGYVNLATGSWDKKSITVDVANGLNESGSVRGRVVAKYLNADSYVDNYEDNKKIFYGVLETDITSSTLLRVGASYQNNDPRGATWGMIPTYLSDGSQADWDISTTTALDWNTWESTNTNYFASLNHIFDNGWQLIANYNKIKYEKSTKLLYINPYSLIDIETGAGLGAQRYNSYGESKQDSFDIQLKGEYELFSQTHEFVVGALYSDQSAFTYTRDPVDKDPELQWDSVPVDNFFEFGGIPEPEWTEAETQTQDMETEQKGYYAATRISVNDDLKFIAGGRIATWLRTGFDWSGNVDYGDENEFIPYAGALYDITEQHRVYASYTEIFKPQNRLTKNGDFIDPLVGESYELGLKSSFLDDRLHTTFAIFNIQQDNLAQIDTSFVPTAEQQTAYYGAQGTESKGFEFEIVGQPIDGLNISAGYSQFDAKDANGNEVNADISDKQFKLFTTYQFVNTLPELSIGGGVNWQNEYSSSGANPVIADQTDKLEQEAFALVNLMARYKFSDNLSAQFNAENLTDEKYKSNVGSFRAYRYGKPRNFTISLNYNF